jgi:hypothetical protein
MSQYAGSVLTIAAVPSMCGAASKISSTLQSQKNYKGSYPMAKNYTMMVLEGTEKRLHTMLTSELSTQEMLGHSQTKPWPPHSLKTSTSDRLPAS